MDNALVIDDVPIVANAIRRQLHLLRAFATVRVASSVAAALAAIHEMPHLRFVTVDLTLEDGVASGFRVVEALQRDRPDALAAIVTGAPDHSVRARAKRLGVRVLPKPYPAAAMKRLVDRALAWPIPWESTAHLVATRSREWHLTRAEHRVFCWKVAGRDPEAYAAEVGLAASTFAFYLKEITRKARWEGGWTGLEAALLRESLSAV